MPVDIWMDVLEASVDCMLQIREDVAEFAAQVFQLGLQLLDCRELHEVVCLFQSQPVCTIVGVFVDGCKPVVDLRLVQVDLTVTALDSDLEFQCVSTVISAPGLKTVPIR